MLASHHVFGLATLGHITCVACGRSYDVDTAWQALVDPCIDGESTGITEAVAKRIYQDAWQSAFGEP